MSYDTMQNVAAHAGGQQARRENFGMRRPGPGGPVVNPFDPLGPARPHVVPLGPARPGNQEAGCHFPAPAPMRVYCQPAAFHRVNGSPFQNLSVAYGSSRPLDRYY